MRIGEERKICIEAALDNLTELIDEAGIENTNVECKLAELREALHLELEELARK
jgi:hypothetical protein